MLECLIMGDSIAVGIAQQARKECSAYVQGGIGSTGYMKKFADKATGQPAKTVVISLGANDYKSKTKENLMQLRERTKADHVFWILPSEAKKPDEARAVKEVAEKFGDTVIPRNEKLISKDGVHPTPAGYQELAKKADIAKPAPVKKGK